MEQMSIWLLFFISIIHVQKTVSGYILLVLRYITHLHYKLCTLGSFQYFILGHSNSKISMGTHKGIYGDEIFRLNETYTES